MSTTGSLLRHIIAAAAAVTIAAALLAGSAPAAEEALPEGWKVVGLTATPGEIEITDRYAYRQLLITAELESGAMVDVTRMAQFEAPEELIDLSSRGFVRGRADGDGELSIHVGGQTLVLPITITGQQEDYKVSFVRDVMPTISKLGCNAGTCHGSAKGKNGFKLSLRGYDPVLDHRALTDDLAGRRFNRSMPQRSLMLLKPSGGIPHVGGIRMRTGEPHYNLLKEWIGDGAKLSLEDSRATGIEILPKDPQIPLAEMTQQMVVLATYSDGTTRDVTAEAFVESSLSEVAEVDEKGLVTAVRRGEAAMLARYEGNYAAASVVVMGDRSNFEWKEPVANNFIDTLVYEKLKRVKILPSELASDADFLRRIYLDLTGMCPEPDEIRAFLADERETQVKRDELIDRLIGSPAYVVHWTHKWSDLLQVNRKFLTEKGAWAARRWVREALESNMPYDRFVYTVLTASGSTYQNPPASYMRVLREPDAAMENSTQLFLGIRFSCNKCHDHPFERWTQNQYHHLAAYFAQVGRKRGPSPGEEIVYDTRGVGQWKHAATGETMPPQFPYQHADMPREEDSRRVQFAHWITSKENPYFASSFVNRLWSYLLGVGLIEPVDDIRAGNPPTNPELLARLAEEFIEHEFDVQHMVRLICKSRTYENALETNQWNEDDEINFSHALARRLPAETLFDCIHQVTGATPKFPGLPSSFRASQLPDSQVKVPGGFLDLFGRPPRESACECERSGGVILGQALNLINGPTVADAIAAPNNRIARLAETVDGEAALVEELFLAILCRLPSEGETTASVAAIGEADSRLEGAQDVAWALVNSPAFLFNH